MRIAAASIALVAWLAPRPAAARPKFLAEDRVYAGASFGVGGPLGSSSLPFALSEGIAALMTLGWAATPHLAAQAFAQYQAVSLTLRDTEEPGDARNGQVTRNDGDVGLFGVDLRLRTSGPTYGLWVSAGVAFGGAQLDLGLEGLSRWISYEVDFGPTPVFAFGAEMRLSDTVRIGPEARWYLVTVQRACETRENGFSLFEGDSLPSPSPPRNPYYYDFEPDPPDQPEPVVERVCNDGDGEQIPDAFYVGLAVTVQP